MKSQDLNNDHGCQLEETETGPLHVHVVQPTFRNQKESRAPFWNDGSHHSVGPANERSGIPLMGTVCGKQQRRDRGVSPGREGTEKREITQAGLGLGNTECTGVFTR